MRAGGGKQKGAAFERAVCKKLSLWVSNGKYQDCFWRSAMSGGRATLAQKKGERLDAQSADISAIRDEGLALCQLFSMECKFYASLDFESMFRGEAGKKTINYFWTKLVQQCGLTKHPMLIAQQNRWEPIVVLTQRGAMLLGMLGKEFAIFPDHDAYFYSFDEFLLNAELRIKPKIKLRLRSK